jgi:hypothetical protein
MARMVYRWLQPNKTPQQIPVSSSTCSSFGLSAALTVVMFAISAGGLIQADCPETWHTRVAPQRELTRACK